MMIRNIQALRAVAAMMVVIYHAIPHYMDMSPNHPFIAALGNAGFIGVDIFFVISGFVIALTTTNQPRNITSAVNFIHHRAARIYLGYWPFLLLIFTIFYKYDPLYLQQHNIIDSLFLYTQKMKYLLPVAWSLTFELFFYMVFVPMFWVPKKMLPRVAIALFILILARNLFMMVRSHSLSEFITSPFLLEFLGGVLLFHYQDFVLRKSLLIPAIAGLAIGFYIGHRFNYESGAPRVYTYGVTAFTIFWIFLFLEKNKWHTFGNIWTRLGDASYTIYLSHTPILYLFYFTGMRDWLGHQHIVLIICAFLMLLIFIIFFSVQFYYTIEAPLYEKACRKLK